MKPIAATAAFALAFTLFACGSGEATAPGTATGGTGAASDARLNLAQGPDVCFRKVADTGSMFSLGSDMDSAAMGPRGQLTICTINYQDPANPRQLLRKTLDVATGVFGAPQPVEIMVMGGNPADFDLEGRLASNDVKSSGFATISPDGTTLKDNSLLPS